MRQTMRVFAGIAVIIAVVLLSLLVWASNDSVQANENSFGSLINDLWNRVLEEQTSESSSNFTFTIEFRDSISGIGNSVTLGRGLNNTQINEIGVDYFCLGRAFSRSRNIDCVPFDNILKVIYQEEL